jgi:hypothetical protein
MKFLSRLILLSICFELVLSPIKPELAMVTVLKANAAGDCPQGMEWNDSANRCLVKASTAQTQRDLEACAKEADPKACYERNANKGANNVCYDKDGNKCKDQDGTSKLTSGDIQAMYKGNSFGLNVAKTTVYALPLMLFGYMMVKKKMFGKNKCLPPSTIAMMAAGVVMLGGEVYGFIKHKSNLKKLDKAREGLFTPKATDNLDQKKVDATQMQSEAFQLLSDEQKSVEELAKTKETFYAVAMSAFAAAAGIAAYELISINLARNKLAGAVAKAATQATDPATVAAVANLKAAYIDYTKSDIKKKKIEAMPIEKSTQKAMILAVKESEEVKIKLANLTTVGATFPEVASAATNYRNLLTKYECWEVTQTDTPSTTNQTTEYNSLKDPRDLKYIKAQIQNLRNAKKMSEIFALSKEIEMIEMGAVSSHLQEDEETSKQALNHLTNTNQLFTSIFADLTASAFESKYFTNETAEIRDSSLLTKIQNELGIPSAYAKEGGGGLGSTLVAILPTAGMMLMSSNVLKGKDKTTPNNTSNGGNDNTSSTNNTSDPSQVESNSEVAPTKNKFDKIIQTPKFRIAFGAILGTLTAFMVKEMNQQKKTARARKETLLKLKGDFENTQGMKICTPQERNDQSQPGCYCYTAEGGRNTARSQSAVCQNLWNSVNLNGTSYLSSSDTNNMVCITQSNAVDEKCSCRASNTCMKASGFNISGISLGTLSTLGSGLAPISTVASGNGADLNTDGLINGAMKLRDATDKVLASKDLKDENAIVKAAEKSLGDFINQNTGTIGSPSARSTPSSLANFDAKAALEELKEEVQSSPDVKGVAASGVGFDSGMSNEPSLEFGLTEQEAAIQEEQVAEVLQQDMDLGNNDISGSSTNLFEVLSHRYKRSGMRRLFDTEGKTEADKPAGTDINQ